MTTGQDPYDALASMFITRSDRTRSGSDGTGSMTIEALLVGHLPVRAGLWLAPYADAMARQAGPTALVRLDRDEPSIQLLRGPDGFVRPDSRLDVREVIFQIAEVAENWVILGRPDHQPDEIAGSDCDRVTILSSADPAAVVAAYDVVKHLAEATREAERSLPRVGLAVLGAESDDAQRVFDRVNRTTTSFLDVELDHVLTLAKMDADVRSTMYLDFPGLPCPTLQQVSGWVRQAGRAQAEHPVDSSAGEVVSSSEARAESNDSGAALDSSFAAEQEVPEQIEAAPLVEVIRKAASKGQEPAAAATEAESVRVAPAPSLEVEPKHAGAVHEPDEDGMPRPLASHVKDLRPLRPRCPNHEHIELAVDGRGRLHLLGREAAVRDLHCVSAWAKAHRELLSMACPEINADFDGRLTCHVFTETPTKVADLYGGDLRLHVLAPVDVAGQRGWFAAPLN